MAWNHLLQLFQQKEEDLLGCHKRLNGFVERAEATCGKIELLKAERDPKCFKHKAEALEVEENKTLAHSLVMVPEEHKSLCLNV